MAKKAQKDLDRAEQEAILAEIARDESAPPSARVTAIRTLGELRGEDDPTADAPSELALIHPSRYKQPKAGTRNGEAGKPPKTS